MTNEYPNLTKDLLDAIAVIMDDDIREEVHNSMAPCHPGEFLTAYLERDPEFPINQFKTEPTE